MKKTAALLLVLLILFSCRSIIVRNAIQDGTWMVGNQIYDAAYVKKADSGETLTAVDFNSNGLNFYFGKYPSGNGNYKIVNNPEAENEVQIAAIFQDTTRAYTTTGEEEKTMKVTFSNGKMTISVPKVTARNVYDSEDLISIEALLTEK